MCVFLVSGMLVRLRDLDLEAVVVSYIPSRLPRSARSR